MNINKLVSSVDIRFGDRGSIRISYQPTSRYSPITLLSINQCTTGLALQRWSLVVPNVFNHIRLNRQRKIKEIK
jgi:hypothetical protein